MPTNDTAGGEELSVGLDFAVECDDCGRNTYMYERYCHHCGYERWESP